MPSLLSGLRLGEPKKPAFLDVVPVLLWDAFAEVVPVCPPPPPFIKPKRTPLETAPPPILQFSSCAVPAGFIIYVFARSAVRGCVASAVTVIRDHPIHNEHEQTAETPEGVLAAQARRVAGVGFGVGRRGRLLRVHPIPTRGAPATAAPGHPEAPPDDDADEDDKYDDTEGGVRILFFIIRRQPIIIIRHVGFRHVGWGGRGSEGEVAG